MSERCKSNGARAPSPWQNRHLCPQVHSSLASEHIFAMPGTASANLDQLTGNSSHHISTGADESMRYSNAFEGRSLDHREARLAPKAPHAAAAPWGRCDGLPASRCSQVPCSGRPEDASGAGPVLRRIMTTSAAFLMLAGNSVLAQTEHAAHHSGRSEAVPISPSPGTQRPRLAAAAPFISLALHESGRPHTAPIVPGFVGAHRDAPGKRSPAVIAAATFGGVVLGAIAGAVVGDRTECFGYCDDATAPTGFLIGGVVGGLAGGVLGGILGWRYERR